MFFVENATITYAGIAHPVERLLPKQKARGSSPLIRSKKKALYRKTQGFCFYEFVI